MTHTQNIERWKAVPGYEGRYEVSDLGRVRSLLGNNVRTLATPLAADGYPVVSLYCSEGKRRTEKVHRLVLLAHRPLRTSRVRYALHRNNDRTNASLGNLYWGTAQQNQLDREAHGTSNHGERNGCSRLTLSQAQSIKQRLINKKRGDLTRLAQEFNVSPSTISDIARGLTWRNA
jgi:hypothetical protein